MGDTPGEVEVGPVSAHLAEDITYSATEFTVDDGSGLADSDFEIKIEDELIFVGVRSGNALQALTRGYGGTDDTHHPFGADVRQVITGQTLADGTDGSKQASNKEGDLSFTAVDRGTIGNQLSVVLKAVENTVDLSLIVADTVITVFLKTDGDGNNLSTVGEIIDAIAADPIAAGLVVASPKSGGSTSDVPALTAGVYTYDLTGGSNGLSTPPRQRQALITADGGDTVTGDGQPSLMSLATADQDGNADLLDFTDPTAPRVKETGTYALIASFDAGATADEELAGATFDIFVSAGAVQANATVELALEPHGDRKPVTVISPMLAGDAIGISASQHTGSDFPLSVNYAHLVRITG